MIVDEYYDNFDRHDSYLDTEVGRKTEWSKEAISFKIIMCNFSQKKVFGPRKRFKVLYSSHR